VPQAKAVAEACLQLETEAAIESLLRRELAVALTPTEAPKD